jgi:hypothetical protein
MRAFFAFFALIAMGCTSPQGIGYSALDVEVTHADGGSVDGFPEKSCTTLPVLIGSRVVHDYSVDGALSIHVDADRGGVGIFFWRGAAEPGAPARRYSVDELSGGVSDQLDVESATGEMYVVYLSSKCPVAQ